MESTPHWDTYCQFRWSPVFLNEHVSICILTYDWERVCLNVCLCACHTNHSCVKMTVGDSWGPWTEHRWRSEIRYFYLLYLHCTLTFSSLSFFTNSRTTHTGKHSLLCGFRIRKGWRLFLAQGGCLYQWLHTEDHYPFRKLYMIRLWSHFRGEGFQMEGFIDVTPKDKIIFDYFPH